MQKHPAIFEKASCDAKYEAWKKVAKELNMEGEYIPDIGCNFLYESPFPFSLLPFSYRLFNSLQKGHTNVLCFQETRSCQ